MRYGCDWYGCSDPASHVRFWASDPKMTRKWCTAHHCATGVVNSPISRAAPLVFITVGSELNIELEAAFWTLACLRGDWRLSGGTVDQHGTGNNLHRFVPATTDMTIVGGSSNSPDLGKIVSVDGKRCTCGLFESVNHLERMKRSSRLILDDLARGLRSGPHLGDRPLREWSREIRGEWVTPEDKS